MEYPVLASSSTLDIPAPVDLWAGSAPITTDRAVASGTIRQYEIVVLMEDGTITPFDGSAPPPSGAKIAGISAVAIPSGQSGPYYTGGYFNWEKIVVNMGANPPITLPMMKTLFALTDIKVGTILK